MTRIDLEQALALWFWYEWALSTLSKLQIEDEQLSAMRDGMFKFIEQKQALLDQLTGCEIPERGPVERVYG